LAALVYDNDQQMAEENVKSPDAHAITRRLHDWREGKREAGDEVIGILYPELRRLAAHYMRMERPGHTLQPTALVNELYVKLMSGARVDWQDRAHFSAFAARKLRHILVDHARRARLADQNLRDIRVALREEDGWTGREEPDIVVLDEVLSRLEEVDSRSCHVLELRFFAGLTEDETAEVLGISVSTVRRDFAFARAFLGSQLAIPAKRPKKS
jgi:RNA polymerase sigma factor (TIGR02999 family)